MTATPHFRVFPHEPMLAVPFTGAYDAPDDAVLGLGPINVRAVTSFEHSMGWHGEWLPTAYRCNAGVKYGDGWYSCQVDHDHHKAHAALATGEGPSGLAVLYWWETNGHTCKRLVDGIEFGDPHGVSTIDV